VTKDARFAPPGTALPANALRAAPIPAARQWWLDPARTTAEIAHRGGYVCISSHGGSGLRDQEELWAFHVAGLTTFEALRAATWSGAHKIGYEQDLGSLEVGKLADLLVLDGNPLDDILKTAAIRYAVKNGVVYDGALLTEVWPAHRALGRFFWQSRDGVRVSP
jgi:imidazolonepropionase-like amidohydrolase